MSIAVSLNEELVKAAQSHSTLQSRSVQQQIEYWAKIGKIVEENPELSYSVVKEFLLGLEDVKAGNVEEYKPLSL
ncbi:hypothetical protein IC220_06005 [Wolbachia endosymbiont of Pentalonia nigronervosa]|jgi:hypothetical protein|uniref:TA system antitoxin ParD family protein n=1 Tax=Wolbachia endosymbiont of Pentalonia nigronervosa TaxID=1301914 RepID=UPI00165FC715|nr:hypothetical protein [Wolbachia endosymbiont of Pentalonia nigronervosa]MBD0391973.1 hypothetical protein [Wolbachia endosymbiont of Pentalonia nigronervosa]